MNEICTKAEIAMREALADFAAELQKEEGVDELNALWRRLRHIERATEQLVVSAGDKADRASARQ